MQLLSKVQALLSKKTPPQEYFLALILKEKTVEAVVWEELAGKAAVVDSAVVFNPKNIEEIEEEELLKLVDSAIGLAEKTLPENIKTTKVIFGLNDWWVEETTIKEPYLGKIKKLCRELELSPLGFVVIPEAIAHLLKSEEGMPPTVLLVSVGEETIGVTFVQAGRIERTKTLLPAEKSAPETVASIIKTFENVEVLPSRMLLFDGHVALEETKQAFLSYAWTKELAFLHFPKIDILPEQFLANAVVSGAARELGFTFDDEVKTVAPAALEEDNRKPEEEDVEKKEETLQDEETPTAKKSQEEKETFGFIKDHDVNQEQKEKLSGLSDEEAKEEEKPIIASPKAESPSGPSFIAGILATLSTFPNMMKGINFPSFSIPVLPGTSGRLWAGIGVALLLLVAFFAVFLFVPKATITITPQTRNFENDAQIAIDLQSSSVDKEKKKIPASSVEIKETGEKNVKTTGKKTIGEKAKGEVTIYNKTENRKTFSKGTILTGPSNLRFTLDDEVSLASTAAFELTPSSIKAKVTADQIGEESNLPANTNLPFKDFPTSSYFAKNEAPFTGGSKKDVVAVSKEDQDTLLAALTEELRGKAKEELTKQSDKNIVDVSMKETIDTKKFSKNVGDEADSLSLTLGITFSTLAYKDSDLLEILGSEIEKNIPQGFTFAKDTFETTVKSVGKNKDVTVLTIHYKAPLTPRIDTNEIKKAIVGKSKKAVEAFLKSLPLTDFSISQTFSLPDPFDLLPQRAENITIELKTP